MATDEPSSDQSGDPSSEDATISEDGRTEILYVSWGGTGRAASVRQAMRRAVAEQRPLRYLAVLDDDHFSDLDRPMIDLVANELGWLLEAQIELTRSQIGAEDLPVSVEVRSGRLVDLVAETVAAAAGPNDENLVLIGAPVPVAGHDSIQTLIDQIAGQTGSKVDLVLPVDRI